MAKSKEQVLSELKEMYAITKPDDDYLNENEDTKEDVDAIEAATETGSSVPVTDQITMLVNFNSDWFPDELPEDEQAEYKALLDNAAKHF